MSHCILYSLSYNLLSYWSYYWPAARKRGDHVSELRVVVTGLRQHYPMAPLSTLSYGPTVAPCNHSPKGSPKELKIYKIYKI